MLVILSLMSWAWYTVALLVLMLQAPSLSLQRRALPFDDR